MPIIVALFALVIVKLNNKQKIYFLGPSFTSCFDFLSVGGAFSHYKYDTCIFDVAVVMLKVDVKKFYRRNVKFVHLYKIKHFWDVFVMSLPVYSRIFGMNF